MNPLNLVNFYQYISSSVMFSAPSPLFSPPFFHFVEGSLYYGPLMSSHLVYLVY